MKLNSDETKYTNRWKFVEVAKYVKSLNKVIREKKDNLPVFLDIKEVNNYAEQHQNIRNIYLNMALRHS